MANAGFQDKSMKVIETFDDIFKDYDYIVAPSASCAAYVRVYYPKILEGKHDCVASKKIMDLWSFCTMCSRSTMCRASSPMW